MATLIPAAGRLPDYPPKTPPPPKRPASPPVPDRAPVPLTFAGRRCGSWTLAELRPWAVRKVCGEIAGRLAKWEHRLTVERRAQLDAIVSTLTEGVIAAGARKVSVHLGDKGRQVVVLIVGHGAGLEPDREVLRAVAAYRVASVGTDSSRQECHAWAVIEP
ncbi:hypothetical protein [Streptacidiphilus albus]|uniref:hypothetical protein n=1 Tax=Streptacidiphilus albus TaxID=105425 RepID=UPI0006913585|nr:hypothetical protein [Streptacidiphilus albus]